MKTYLTRVFWDNPYPVDKVDRVEASNFALAAKRALTKWRKDNPRKRINRVKVEVAII